MKEWEVLAEESLDAVLEPGVDIAADPPKLAQSSASITWRGDGKYFATVTLSAGKSPSSHACHLCDNLYLREGKLGM